MTWSDDAGNPTDPPPNVEAWRELLGREWKARDLLAHCANALGMDTASDEGVGGIQGSRQLAKNILKAIGFDPLLGVDTDSRTHIADLLYQALEDGTVADPDQAAGQVADALGIPPADGEALVEALLRAAMTILDEATSGKAPRP